MGLLDDIGKYEADKEFFDELEKFSAKARVDSSIFPGPPPKADVSAPIIPPWEHDVERGRATMEELMASDFLSEASIAEPAIMPFGKRIIPVRAVKEVSMMELAERRKFFSPDQLNEQIVHELLRPLVEQLDEMGLIDLEVKRDADRLLYSITLNVVKDERS